MLNVTAGCPLEWRQGAPRTLMQQVHSAKEAFQHGPRFLFGTAAKGTTFSPWMVLHEVELGLQPFFETIPASMFTAFRCFTGECAARLCAICTGVCLKMGWNHRNGRNRSLWFVYFCVPFKLTLRSKQSHPHHFWPMKHVSCVSGLVGTRDAV